MACPRSRIVVLQLPTMLWAVMAAVAGGPSRPAFADTEGSAYRGKIHCKDKDVSVILDRYVRCGWLDEPVMSASIIPIPKASCMTGATNIRSGNGLGVSWRAPSQHAWFATSLKTETWPRWLDAPNTPFATITKLWASKVAINALVCTYEFPGLMYWYLEDYRSKPLVFVKETSGRMAHDATQGTTMRLALPNKPDATVVNLVYLESESALGLFKFQIEFPGGGPRAAEAAKPATT